MILEPKFCQWKEYRDDRGSLSAVEYPENLPFLVKRIFYIYDVVAGQTRGNHAHKKLEQFLVCLAGSVEVFLESVNGHKVNYRLDRRNQGIYVPPMTWVKISHFQDQAVCIVLASDKYLESDYIRDYDEFLRINKK